LIRRSQVRALVGEPLRIKDVVRIRRMLDGLRLVTATSRLPIEDRGRARRADLLPCPQDSPRPPTRPTILEAMEPRLPEENLLHCLGADDLAHFGALGHHLHLLVL